MNTNWSVHSPSPRSWSVSSPSRNRGWTGAPSQTAAFGLALSLAGIDTMLADVAHREFGYPVSGVPAPRRQYGCYVMPGTR